MKAKFIDNNSFSITCENKAEDIVLAGMLDRVRFEGAAWSHWTGSRPYGKKYQATVYFHTYPAEKPSGKAKKKKR